MQHGRQPLLPEKLFWEYIIESDRVRYFDTVVDLCSSQDESSLFGSPVKPLSCGGFKTVPSLHLLISECPSAYERPPE
jgi:hypothetical protein